MSFSVQIPPGQIASAQELLKFIDNGYPRAMTRALNVGAASAKAKTFRALKAHMTAAPTRIRDSLSVTRATYGRLGATMRTTGDAIKLIYFDVTASYPTKLGGVSATLFTGGGGAVRLKHAFLARVNAGDGSDGNAQHLGVFIRKGPPRRMTRGRYIGQMRQPIVESFGPNSATALLRTPGLADEITAEAAEKFLKEFDRQVDLLLSLTQGTDPPEPS